MRHPRRLEEHKNPIDNSSLVADTMLVVFGSLNFGYFMRYELPVDVMQLQAAFWQS
jgi:hypothetical protein